MPLRRGFDAGELFGLVAADEEEEFLGLRLMIPALFGLSSAFD
jgi:hypothetical protein